MRVLEGCAASPEPSAMHPCTMQVATKVSRGRFDRAPVHVVAFLRVATLLTTQNSSAKMTISQSKSSTFDRILSSIQKILICKESKIEATRRMNFWNLYIFHELSYECSIAKICVDTPENGQFKL